MCSVVTLLGFDGYFVHQLSQLFLARLLIDVYETIVIHNNKPLRLQRYNKKLIYASFFVKKRLVIKELGIRGNKKGEALPLPEKTLRF